MARDQRSVLIAIEGIDGAGKTTQVVLLHRALESLGRTVVVSKEPTDGPFGRMIKESASAGRYSPEAELDLFIKDRSEHVSRLINPALERGSVVILDRYFYSTIAYQGCRGMDPSSLEQVMRARFPTPDAVFILDIEPELSTFRIAHSRGETPNRFEDRADLAKARAIFNNLKGPEIYFIDGSATPERVHGEILDKVVKGPLALGESAGVRQ
jgi:dTMP kinase